MKNKNKWVLQIISYAIVLATIVVYSTAPILIQVITMIAGIVYFKITHDSIKEE